jgi:hypothetical protein
MPRCMATFSLVVSAHSGGTNWVNLVCWNPPSATTSSFKVVEQPDRFLGETRHDGTSAR